MPTNNQSYTELTNLRVIPRSNDKKSNIGLGIPTYATEADLPDASISREGDFAYLMVAHEYFYFDRVEWVSLITPPEVDAPAYASFTQTALSDLTVYTENTISKLAIGTQANGPVEGVLNAPDDENYIINTGDEPMDILVNCSISLSLLDGAEDTLFGVFIANTGADPAEAFSSFTMQSLNETYSTNISAMLVLAPGKKIGVFAIANQTVSVRTASFSLSVLKLVKSIG